MAVVAIVATAFLVTGPAVAQPSHLATDDQISIMVVGDSISFGCDSTPLSGWCADLDSLLTTRGIDHTIAGHVIPEQSCVTLQPGFAARFTAITPDLVIMACGTNDATATQAQIDWLGDRWRTMVEYAHTNGAMVLPSFVQYSNPEINAKNGRGWLVGSEGSVNDTIFRQLPYYQPYGWFAGLVDFQQVPGDWNNLNGGNDGIHPNTLGKQVYAALVYRSLQAFYGWPATVAAPCGMWGHRAIYEPPSYITCTGMIGT
jgi:lysophospholipase L1-like esterase